MLGCWERLQRILHRKKTLDETSILTTELRRCLSTFNLTFFAVGMMIGTGIFVLTGTMTRDLAGPAVVVSYIISGLATLLSALCYAELGARIPRAGSAYMYTYVAVGEPLAFFIGWNMLWSIWSVLRPLQGDSVPLLMPLPVMSLEIGAGPTWFRFGAMGIKATLILWLFAWL